MPTPSRSVRPRDFPSVWDTYHDHRMVMAGAVVALRVPGMVLDDPDTVSKTMPSFVDLWTEAVSA